MTERAKLRLHLLILPTVGILLAASACSRPQRASGVYAHDTRELVRIDYDRNGDGVIDVRTYMREGRPVRLESDGDGDGRIDRWEYYDGSGALLRVGSSTRLDGREDAWVRQAGRERVVELSTARDNRVDRREFHRDGVLVRTESDSDGDGRVDVWEEFENGALVRVLFDEDKRHGRPTRRIVYGADGDAAVEPVEQDGRDPR